jgi:hypothetical protein
MHAKRTSEFEDAAEEVRCEVARAGNAAASDIDGDSREVEVLEAQYL